METYILRVYRRLADQPNSLVGILQSVQSREEFPFRSFAELRVLLLSSHNGAPEGPNQPQRRVEK